MSLVNTDTGERFDPLHALGLILTGRSSESLAARPTTMTTLVDDDEKPCKWPDVRAYVLRRDDHTCQTCGAPANEVDHIFPRRRGGSDFLENLQALCGTCNREKGARADLQAAVFPDLAGGVDIAMERIAAEFETVLLPALMEMVDRAKCEDTTDPAGVRQLLESVSAKVDRLSLQVSNRIHLMHTEVES